MNQWVDQCTDSVHHIFCETNLITICWYWVLFSYYIFFLIKLEFFDHVYLNFGSFLDLVYLIYRNSFGSRDFFQNDFIAIGWVLCTWDVKREELVSYCRWALFFSMFHLYYYAIMLLLPVHIDLWGKNKVWPKGARMKHGGFGRLRPVSLVAIWNSAMSEKKGIALIW